MGEYLVALESFAPIAALRFSRWSYAVLNAGHIFAIALLVGGSVPLALRLFGFWPTSPREDIVRVLTLTTGAGLGLALISGSLLFATRASEYAGNSALLVKLIFIGVGATSAIFAHSRHGWTLGSASDATARRIAIISCLCWVGALVAGRMIAFMPG